MENKFMLFTPALGLWVVCLPKSPPRDSVWSEWREVATAPTLQHAIVAGAYYAVTQGTAS